MIAFPQLCPCGCGHRLPDSLGKDFDTDVVGRAMERWVTEQGLTMSQIRSANREAKLVEARRRIAVYLHAHSWSTVAIGRFISRDHTTVGYLLRGENAG